MSTSKIVDKKLKTLSYFINRNVLRNTLCDELTFTGPGVPPKKPGYTGCISINCRNCLFSRFGQVSVQSNNLIVINEIIDKE